jgi:4-nitrophenyl phosphatase
MTPGYATALYLSENGLLPATAYVISDGGLQRELASAGVEVLDDDDQRPADYVVIGMDRGLSYAKLERAQQEILRGAKFIASNADPTYPVEGGVMPGAGTVVSAVQTATGQEPVLIGKPKTYMIDQVLERAGVGRGEVLMIGDRLTTDIELAKRAGVTAALVLTGVTTRAEATRAPDHQRPDWILRDLGELPGRLVGRRTMEPR